jgi:hypothetical protein
MTWPQAKFMPWDQLTRVGQTKSRFLPVGSPYVLEDQWRELRVAEERQT